MKKVKLDFMVYPEFLKNHAYVPKARLIKIIDPEAIFLTGILGESGKKLIKAGAPFYFTEKIAINLVKKGIAEWIE
jgi:hypothetical protein